MVRKIKLNFRSGKSYTMQGVNISGSPQRGITPRSFEVRIYRFERKLCTGNQFFKLQGVKKVLRPPLQLTV